MPSSPIKADPADPAHARLAANASTQRGDPSSTVADRADTAVRQVEPFTAGALERVKARGGPSSEENPREPARFLTTFLQGVRIAGRSRTGRRFADDALTAAMRLSDRAKRQPRHRTAPSRRLRRTIVLYRSIQKENTMELHLKDKVAVVTGASKGIGLAVVERLAGEGAKVVAGSRTSTPELDALAAKHDVTVVSVDLSTAEGAERLVQQAVEKYGRIDVLVNNVGAAEPRESFLKVTDEDWRRIFDLTFFSAVRTSRAALPHLVQAGGGSIVNISSINARLPFPTVVDYSAAKAALTNLNKALSEEFAPQGVRVNAVSPGPVRTPFWTAPGAFADATAAAAGVTAQEALDVVLPQSMGISSGRITEAHEVADLTLFLASPVAGNITGAEIIIDGGQVKTL